MSSLLPVSLSFRRFSTSVCKGALHCPSVLDPEHHGRDRAAGDHGRRAKGACCRQKRSGTTFRPTFLSGRCLNVQVSCVLSLECLQQPVASTACSRHRLWTHLDRLCSSSHTESGTSASSKLVDWRCWAGAGAAGAGAGDGVRSANSSTSLFSLLTFRDFFFYSKSTNRPARQLSRRGSRANSLFRLGSRRNKSHIVTAQNISISPGFTYSVCIIYTSPQQIQCP